MSLMTTPSKMVTSALSMANARLLAGDARGYPRDGAGMDDNRRWSGVMGGSAIPTSTSSTSTPPVGLSSFPSAC
jgi:hypothetical protein